MQVWRARRAELGRGLAGARELQATGTVTTQRASERASERAVPVGTLRYPFDTGRLSLSDGGNPGVNGLSYRGGAIMYLDAPVYIWSVQYMYTAH